MFEPIKEWLTQEELVEELKQRGIDMTGGRKDRNVRRTLYYYRYKGLITPPTRKRVGKRVTLFYHNSVIIEITTIRRMREQGKKLGEIESYMKKLMKSGFVSDVESAIREVEKQYESVPPDVGMVVLSALGGDGQFIHVKIRPENLQEVKNLMEKIGISSDAVIHEEPGETTE